MAGEIGRRLGERAKREEGMVWYRTSTVAFERQLTVEHPSGGASPNRLARRRDIAREPLRIWIRRYGVGGCADDGPAIGC